MRSFIGWVTVGMALALLLAAVSASAQPVPCSPRDILVERLQQKYGEKRVGRGVALDGKAVVELFAVEGGTWSVIITQANMISCVVATGTDWETLVPEPEGSGT